MYNLLLIGLKDGKNLGDAIINECTKYLVNKSLLAQNLSDKVNILELDMESQNLEVIKEADCIIFVGGGIIKFKYQNFYKYIDIITQIANKYNISVYFHAVGVEGFDINDEKFNQLKVAINRHCVKQISVRDNIDLLKKYYIVSSHINIKQISDSAVWVPEVYNITKKNSNIIGLGMIREGIFRSNGIDIGFEELVSLWQGILQELERRGFEFKLFTTGWPSDAKFIYNFANALTWSPAYVQDHMITVTSCNDLVQTIAGFQGVIAGRLHANIISYALDIPSIGIVWNDKLKQWGSNIGYPQRFFPHQQFCPENIINALLLAMSEGYQKINKESFKETSYRSIFHIIQTINCL